MKSRGERTWPGCCCGWSLEEDSWLRRGKWETKKAIDKAVGSWAAWVAPLFLWLLKFELWTLNNFNGTVSFTHSFLSDRAGGAGLADLAIARPMFWLRWCCWPLLLVGEKHTYYQHTFVPARTSRSECKRELRKPGNKHIESMVATYCWRALFGIKSRVTKY